MIIPMRFEFALYEGRWPTEVWMVVGDDAWYIYCMDCGTRIGTVNIDNEAGAVRLTEDHRRTLHG